MKPEVRDRLSRGDMIFALDDADRLEAHRQTIDQMLNIKTGIIPVFIFHLDL